MNRRGNKNIDRFLITATKLNFLGRVVGDDSQVFEEAVPRGLTSGREQRAESPR